MKIKNGFILRTSDDINLIVATGEAAKAFNGIITLNDTAVFMWKQLEKGADVAALTQALTAEYNVDAERAENDAKAFVSKLVAAGVVDE